MNFKVRLPHGTVVESKPGFGYAQIRSVSDPEGSEFREELYKELLRGTYDKSFLLSKETTHAKAERLLCNPDQSFVTINRDISFVGNKNEEEPFVTCDIIRNTPNWSGKRKLSPSEMYRIRDTAEPVLLETKLFLSYLYALETQGILDRDVSAKEIQTRIHLETDLFEGSASSTMKLESMTRSFCVNQTLVGIARSVQRMVIEEVKSRMREAKRLSAWGVKTLDETQFRLKIAEGMGLPRHLLGGR
jgi:hypothetical protein